MLKMIKLTKLKSDTDCYLMIDKIQGIFENDEDPGSLVHLMGNKYCKVNEFPREIAELIEAASKPSFVFGDINTEEKEESKYQKPTCDSCVNNRACYDIVNHQPCPEECLGCPCDLEDKCFRGKAEYCKSYRQFNISDKKYRMSGFE